MFFNGTADLMHNMHPVVCVTLHVTFQELWQQNINTSNTMTVFLPRNNPFLILLVKRLYLPANVYVCVRIYKEFGIWI